MEFSSGRARRKVFSAGLEATALRQARMPAATTQVSESDFGVRVEYDLAPKWGENKNPPGVNREGV